MGSDRFPVLDLDPSFIAPDDAGWDAARAAWNRSVDQRPALVAAPRSVDDVVAAVGAARQRGLRVAPQGTGHGAAALTGLDGALLLRMGGLDGVEIDVAARRARVGGGARWGSVVTEASAHGLAPLAGFAAGVGVTGYCLGGGLGWLARKHGLACDSVVAATVVTADGRVLRVDAEHEPDLFWALRGAGGGFAVVVELELELHPVDPLHAGALAWPWERAGEVLAAWAAWTASVPDEVTSVGRIIQVPDLPMAPPPLRGRSLVLIEAAVLADGGTAAELLAPLRALDPELDLFGPMPPAALTEIHNDPVEPVPAVGAGLLLDELPPGALDAFVGAAGPGSGSPLASIELRHLGGALARAAEGAGPLGALAEPFALFGVGMAMGSDHATAIAGQLEHVREALGPWRSGRALANFAEAPSDGRACFDADTYARLARVRRRYDPDRTLLAAHEVAPAVE
jgi:FAD/FMN-containing dehydrogenase